MKKILIMVLCLLSMFLVIGAANTALVAKAGTGYYMTVDFSSVSDSYFFINSAKGAMPYTNEFTKQEVNMVLSTIDYDFAYTFYNFVTAKIIDDNVVDLLQIDNIDTVTLSITENDYKNIGNIARFILVINIDYPIGGVCKDYSKRCDYTDMDNVTYNLNYELTTSTTNEITPSDVFPINIPKTELTIWDKINGLFTNNGKKFSDKLAELIKGDSTGIMLYIKYGFLFVGFLLFLIILGVVIRVVSFFIKSITGR